MHAGLDVACSKVSEVKSQKRAEPAQGSTGRSGWAQEVLDGFPVSFFVLMR